MIIDSDYVGVEGQGLGVVKVLDECMIGRVHLGAYMNFVVVGFEGGSGRMESIC